MKHLASVGRPIICGLFIFFLLPEKKGPSRSLFRIYPGDPVVTLLSIGGKTCRPNLATPSRPLSRL